MKPVPILVAVGALVAVLAICVSSSLASSAEPVSSETVPEQRVALLTTEGDGASYWPRWRGPSGQGQVEDMGYVDTWSSTENVLWKSVVPGRGNSSPIVWGDRIFVTASYKGGDRRAIFAFDRGTGEQIWVVDVPSDARDEDYHPKNSLASSTPTTDGELVYGYFGNDGVMAVDFDGKVVWHQPLGLFNAFHGTASSPLLYKDRLIVVQDARNNAFIAAFDKKTGEELWRTKRRAQVGWNTPIPVRVEGQDQIVVSSMQQVIAYDPQTGLEIWHARGNTFEAIPTPVVGHDLIYASSGRAGPTLAIRPLRGDGHRSGKSPKAEIVWRASKGSPFVPSPILDGDHLFMVNDMASIATCYDARSGEVLWQGRLGRASREGFSASPVLVGNKVYFTNDEGVTFVLASGAEFEILHTNDLEEPVLASPALVDGIWYFRTARHLLAIGRPESSETGSSLTQSSLIQATPAQGAR